MGVIDYGVNNFDLKFTAASYLLHKPFSAAWRITSTTKSKCKNFFI